MTEEKQKGMLLAWLKDAYATEKSLEETLKIMVKEATGYPMVQEKLQEHLETTQSQAERLSTRLTELGEDTSKMKSISAEIMGRIQGYGTKFSNDKIIKNSVMSFAAEYFEIASYRAIATAAEKMGDEETAGLVQDIMQEEQEMADWAEEHLPDLVMEFMDK